MNIPRSVVENWVRNLSRTCSFFACEGSRKPPLDMITCNVCSSAWEMKQYLYGLTPKQIKQKMKEYQEVFDLKTKQDYTGDENEKKYAYLVQHFSYNGFTGKLRKGIAPYMAKFKEWTRDPGIGRFECSDNVTRLIPTFALKGLKRHPLLKQDMTNKVVFGAASHS